MKISNYRSLLEEHRSRNILIASLTFLYAFVIYTMTVAPTASFWDPSEYIAISHTLQVAHPPGSPYFALWGRLFSMFVPSDQVALSINMISVLASSFTVMLLYLVIVRFIQEWKGPADNMSSMDLTGLYGGGLFGSLVFAVTHTQWFNAVEAEMYASSMFFTALVVWLVMKWAENHEEPRSEKWLLLIAYLIGLGIGVHLLNLLALFFVALIIYFKKFEFRLTTFLIMTAVSVAIFLAIYPFTIIYIPTLADDIGRMTYGLIGPLSYLVIVTVIVSYAIYYTQKKKMRTANLVGLAFALILTGYTSYALVFIRSQANPAINQNNPSTVEAFVSYLKREQYGASPLLSGHTYNSSMQNIDTSREVLFPRRHSQQGSHLEYYDRFDSDLQYFWEYQVHHMYLRYLFWNFIGKESDIQNAGWYSGFGETPHSKNPANRGYFYLPFLFGLLGMLYHFRNDWRRGLSVLTLFFLTGLAIIFYLNQTPHEPRERDYAYVGSFFAYSIWVGLGLTGLLEMIRSGITGSRSVQYGLLGLAFLAVPFWMARENWASQDRSDNYVARDYAYNLLQSVEQNAILFTNGDNDTFPLWYIQEVEGVRTDVRVVNLSLLNTNWYIKQMRDQQAHESLPLPIRMTDSEIDEMTSGLTLHEPAEIIIPVDHSLLHSAFGSQELPEHLSSQSTDEIFLNQFRSAVPYSLPVDSLDSEVSWYLEGRFAGQDQQGNDRYYLQTQDRMILEILRENRWLRPVYFANTVSPDGQLGLQPWFQFEGKAFRVVPKERQTDSFGHIDPDIHAQRLESFQFQEWNNLDTYFDENIRRMLTNYRQSFTQLTDLLIQRGDLETAARWLSYGEEVLPFRDYELDWTLPALYSYRYMRADLNEDAVRLADFTADHILHWMEWEIRELVELEQRINRLDGEASEARAAAQMDRYNQLNSQSQQYLRELQTEVQSVQFQISRLTILQYVYYQTGDKEKADRLRTSVTDLIQNNPYFEGLPSSLEESNERILDFNLPV